MMDPTEAYKYDSTFRHMVDIMRQELTHYEITPAELRQAAILAATMHESERIRPLFYTKPYFPKSYWGMQVFMDEAKNIPPAMFGGLQDCATGKTATGANLAPEHCHIFSASGHGYGVCHCGISDVYYNWSTKPENKPRKS
jgi:hypothetical protein